MLRTLPPHLAGFLVFLFLAINVLSHDDGMVLNLSGVAVGAPILALLIFYRQYLILKENMLLYSAAKEAREEAERATHDKADFLATISHKIRTPMHGVIGMSELLIDSGLNEKQAGMAETLPSSGQHLLNVINDVLDLSENRKQVLDELIDVFLTDGTDRVALMRKALSEGTVRAVKEEAHSLKGSSSVFGLQALVTNCAKIEVVDESNDLAIADLENMVVKVATEFELARQKLSSLRLA